MIITRIILKNWKNFGEVDIRCGKRVFLIGPNASGKSNFLDALLFLRDVAQDGLDKAVERRGGMKAIRALSAREQPDITISVTIDDHWEYTLVFGTEVRSSSPLVKEERVVLLKSDVPGSKEILSRPDADDKHDTLRLTQTALQQINANKDFRDIPEAFSTIQYRHILPQLVRHPKGFSPSSPINSDPYGRDLVLQIWKTTPRTRDARLKKINDTLRIAVPQLDSLSVVQDDNGIPHLNTKYKHWRAHGAKQNESALSDGTLRLLALLWTLLDTGGPLLLEEPELSLHDDIIRQLPALFAKLDKTKKKAARQVFITTHSEAMLGGQEFGENEVLRLEPTAEGTAIKGPDPEDIELMRQGLSPAEVLLPKTRPHDIHRISLFDIS